MPNSELSSDLWDIPEATGAPSTMEADVDAEGDETNDLEVYGHEVRHVMSETMSTLLMEHAPTNRKWTRWSPMKIMRYCVVLFDGLHNLFNISSRGLRIGQKGRRDGQTNQVWFGRVQKIRMKYNGKWGKSRSEIDLLDRPVAQSSEGCCCQVLFNWYSPIPRSRIKFTYDNTQLQWIDLESVITIVSLKMERSVRVLWILDSKDKGRVDEFVTSL
ncbi:hypothetical protein R1flu_010077 [Riccia fluitans]|uniref:Uncharacterized protein n=1 Tax=Riccia fluitans TaxID=41844 RepID=A0ABD1Z448_9MARC